MVITNPALFKTNSMTNIESSPTILPLGSVDSGTLTSANNNVSYVFTITVSGAYSINFTFIPVSGYTMTYTVKNSTGGLFIPSSQYGIAQTPQTQMFYADSFTLEILGQGQYNVSVFQAPQGVIPADPVILPLNTISNEKMPNWSYYQNIYYNVTLPYYTTYKFIQNYSGPGNLTAVLQEPQSQIVLFNDFTQHSITETLTAGNYSIHFHKMSYSGTFNFSVEIEPSFPYYTVDSAVPINLNSPVTGNISITNLYNVTIPSNGSYTFNLTADQGTTFWYYIFNSTENMVGNITLYSYPEQITLDLSAGYYYIQLYDISGSGYFSLEISSNNAAPPPSTTSSISTTPTKSTTTTSSSSSTTTISTKVSSPSSTTQKQTSSSTNSKTSPFSSLEVIFLSIILIGSVSLILRRRK